MTCDVDDLRWESDTGGKTTVECPETKPTGTMILSRREIGPQQDGYLHAKGDQILQILKIIRGIHLDKVAKPTASQSESVDGQQTHTRRTNECGVRD